MDRCSPLFLAALAQWGVLALAATSPRLLNLLGAASLAACAAALSALGPAPVQARRAGPWLLACGAGLALGVLGARLPAGGPPSGLPLEQVREFTGLLTEDSTPVAGGGMRYRVRVRSVRGPEAEARTGGEVTVSVAGGPPLPWGRRLTVAGRLQAVREQGRERAVSRVDRRDLSPGPYVSRLLRVRAEVRAGIQRRFSALGRPVSALLGALLLGDRAGIPEEERALFQASGSLHVLALSGLHAGILFAAAAFLLSWLPDRRWRTALGAALLFPYLFLAGWSPSLARAVLMLAAAAAGYLLDRDRRPLDLLALASVLILAADPTAAGELSYQLSFLALLGIGLVGRPLARALTPPLPVWLGLPLAVSLGAQAATAPLLLARFGAAYPAGALAALPLLPLVTAFLWGGLVCLLLSATPLLPLLAVAMSLLHRLILAVLGFFARFPPVRARWVPAYWAPAAAVLAALLFLRLPARRRL